MHINTENPDHQTDHQVVYDIIIAGAGCAGLSLLHGILQSPNLQSKKILVIDTSFQKSNDRTWCFWETTPSVFESLVCKKWSQIEIQKNSFTTQLATAPFVYKMIEGLDFYNYVISAAKQFENISWQEAYVSKIEEQSGNAMVEWEGGSAIAKQVFSSILPLDSLYAISQSQKSNLFLWQHFKGQLIEFELEVFDEGVARLMDFNVDQKGATAFMYVLPLTPYKALVEYTLFSKALIKPDEYNQEITNYIQTHYPDKQYKLLHEEVGAIPMTSNALAQSKAPIYVIGTLGNAVKASTGYAFKFIQNQVAQIIAGLEKGSVINTSIHNSRHGFYDTVLLYILENKLMEGSEIFKRIFEKNNAATIFKFLSNTSTIWEDVQIMRSLPTKIFLPAAIKVMLRRAV